MATNYLPVTQNNPIEVETVSESRQKSLKGLPWWYRRKRIRTDSDSQRQLGIPRPKCSCLPLGHIHRHLIASINSRRRSINVSNGLKPPSSAYWLASYLLYLLPTPSRPAAAKLLTYLVHVVRPRPRLGVLPRLPCPLGPGPVHLIYLSICTSLSYVQVY